MKNPKRQRWTNISGAYDLDAMASFALLICLWLLPLAGSAQATPRDYSIAPPRVNYSPDGAVAIVSFTISNQGGDAAEPSQIVISEYQSGRVQTVEPLPPLAADQAQNFTIQLPLADLTADGIISFKIEAGIDAFELANSPIALDNSQLFHIDRSAAGATNGDNSLSELPSAEATYQLFIPIINLGVNFLDDGIQLNDNRYTGGDILRLLGLLAVALFCLWLLSLILRLIFRRPPPFEVWQPPYAVNNWHDPNSALGRRQSWQFHAQNSAIAGPSAPDQVAVVKRLLDKRGVILGSWKVKAMRTVQYDIYGRINRTEALMPRKMINQLNQVIRRAPSYANHDLHKAIAPIAKRLSKVALAHVEKQNLMLPLALDIRFEGITDEVRIQFELFQYRDSAWHLIDQWEPEFGQVGEHVPEHFTFTLNGQLSGESKGEYRTRLHDDMTQLLAGLFHHHQVEHGDARHGYAESHKDEPDNGEALWTALDDETDPNALPQP